MGNPFCMIVVSVRTPTVENLEWGSLFLSTRSLSLSSVFEKVSEVLSTNHSLLSFTVVVGLTVGDWSYILKKLWNRLYEVVLNVVEWPDVTPHLVTVFRKWVSSQKITPTSECTLSRFWLWLHLRVGTRSKIDNGRNYRWTPPSVITRVIRLFFVSGSLSFRKKTVICMTILFLSLSPVTLTLEPVRWNG